MDRWHGLLGFFFHEVSVAPKVDVSDKIVTETTIIAHFEDKILEVECLGLRASFPCLLEYPFASSLMVVTVVAASGFSRGNMFRKAQKSGTL